MIPTRAGDLTAVRACVSSLLDQLLESDEIIVSLDGDPPNDTARTGPLAHPCVRTVSGPQTGPGGARNRGLSGIRGETVLFLNDDVIAHDGLLDAHRRAHSERNDAAPAMVLGDAPWETPGDDRVLDRLLRETSMVFFYDRMTGNDPGHDWGFRHAWTLNLSLPAAICERFDERLTQPMFDDLEWAARVQQNWDAPVLYRPSAGVTHRHRYTPEMLLRREALLGHQAAELHRVNPGVAGAVFGERYTPTDEQTQTHADHLAGRSEEARASFGALIGVADAPADSIDQHAIRTLFESSRPWRDAARSVGFIGWIEGRSPATVQNEALGLIAPGTPAREVS